MKRLIIFLLIPMAIKSQTNYAALLDNFMKANEIINLFNGTVIVMKEDKLIYEKSFGEADREWNIDNTIETKYKIASVTKQFTATCILFLEEQGKLRLEDKLSDYIPDYPKGDSITIHMLLNHTSGIKNLTEISDYFRYEKTSSTPDSLISIFKNQPLDFSPGTNFHYSNSGYILLGYIIEKVSGQTYAEFLQQFFKKIGLENTAYNDMGKILMYRASGYIKTPTGYENAPFIPVSIPYSAGGICSTVEDLYKWNKALMKNQLLSPSSVKKMTTAYLGNYGYGLIVDNFKSHLRLTHSGAIPGFTAATTYFPTDNIFIAILSNNESNAVGLTEGLSDIMFDIPVELPYIHKEMVVDSKILDRYLGTYDGAFSFQIIKKDNKLYRYRPDRGDVELKPESLTKLFFADNSDRQIEFQISKTNKVMKVFFISGGAKTEISKTK